MGNNLEGIKSEETNRNTTTEYERRTTLFTRKLLSNVEPQVGTPEKHAAIVAELETNGKDKGKGKGKASPSEGASNIAGIQDTSKSDENPLKMQPEAIPGNPSRERVSFAEQPFTQAFSAVGRLNRAYDSIYDAQKRTASSSVSQLHGFRSNLASAKEIVKMVQEFNASRKAEDYLTTQMTHLQVESSRKDITPELREIMNIAMETAKLHQINIKKKEGIIHTPDEIQNLIAQINTELYPRLVEKGKKS